MFCSCWTSSEILLGASRPALETLFTVTPAPSAAQRFLVTAMQMTFRFISFRPQNLSDNFLQLHNKSLCLCSSELICELVVYF